MNSISIQELYEIQDRKELEKINIYNKILNKFYEKIKYLSKNGKN